MHALPTGGYADGVVSAVALVPMYVVPSTRNPHRLSVRLSPLDQLATPLIDAIRAAVSDIAQSYEDGDKLELRLVARKVGRS